MNNLDTITQLATFIQSNLDLSTPLSEEYYYAHLSCCVLDAVFSIGTRYSSTRKVPIRYCDHYTIPRLRKQKTELPSIRQQESLAALVEHIEKTGAVYFAQHVVQNNQRTSTRNGLLKAEASHDFAKVLVHHGVCYFQDLIDHPHLDQIEADILNIKGQSSGISWRYFLMLAGDEQEVKPDRMILRFLEYITHQSFELAEAVKIIQELVKHPLLLPYQLSPRHLDHIIWLWQREQA